MVPPPPLVRSATEYETCFAVGLSKAKMRIALDGTRSAPSAGYVATILGCAREVPAARRSAAGIPKAVKRLNFELKRGSPSRGGGLGIAEGDDANVS
jgi:hypothetical protein